MNRFRFSIGSILAVITVLGLGLGAIASQSALAACMAYTLFVGVLCLAGSVALAPQSPRRAFCTGFAIFGLVYWLVEFHVQEAPAAGIGAPGTAWTTSPPVGGNQAELTLVTRPLIVMIERNMTPRLAVGTPVLARWANNGRYYRATIVQEANGQYQVQWVDGGTTQWTAPGLIVADSEQPMVAGHALMGGLFALLGGVLTALFAPERSARSETSTGRAATV
jgi:hypothetical protein